MPQQSSVAAHICLLLLLSVAGTALVAWFVPGTESRAARSVTVDPDRYPTRGDGMTLFRNEDELRRSMGLDDTELITAVPEVDFEANDLVRICYSACGYKVSDTDEVRFGQVGHRSRLFGYRHFFFFHEPVPFEWIVNINRVFVQVRREEWWTIPKGARVEWNNSALTRITDWGFGLSLAAVIVAFIGTTCRMIRPRKKPPLLAHLRRRPPFDAVTPTT